MLVTIVAVPNATNTGIDVDRVEKVEDIPVEVARQMVDLGTARLPSEDELETYRETKIAELEQRVADAETEPAGMRDPGPDPDAPVDIPNLANVRTSKKNPAPAVEPQPDAAPPAA